MEKPSFEFTVDRHEKPLIIWNNPPGLYAEFSPFQMRKLATELYNASNIAEAKS